MAFAKFSRKKGGTFAPVLSPKGNPPVNITLPVVSGTFSIGSILTTSLGTWTRTPTQYYIQWQRDRHDIPGATLAFYTIQNADLGHTIECLVTAWNNDGSGYARSLGITSSGGGASATFNGLNLIDHFRGYDVPFTDLFQGDDFFYVKSGTGSVVLPTANRDANGWPISVPVDTADGLIYYVVRYPLTTGNVDFTLTSGKFDTLATSGPNFSLVSYDNNQHAVLNFTATTAAQPGIAQIKFVPNAATPPKGFSMIPTGRTGRFTPEFLAKLSAFKGRGPVRTIKWQPAVENNLTVTTRNTLSSAIWWWGNDGVPLEVILELGATAQVDLWMNFGLLESDAVLNQKFALIDAHLTSNPALKVYIQSSNEDWNGLYFGNVNTLRTLAAADGLDGSTPGVAISSITHVGTTATVTTSIAHGRTTGDSVTVYGASPSDYIQNNTSITVTGATTFTYVMGTTPTTNATTVGNYVFGATDVFGGQLKESSKRSNHVMDLLVAAINATRLSRVTRVIGTWNAVPTTTDTLLAWTGTPSKHDMLVTGAYWSNVNSGNGYPSEPWPKDGTTRTTPLNVQYTTADFPAILTDLKTGTDAVFDLSSQNQVKAAAAGLTFGGYEFGIERHFTDNTIALNWYESQQVHDATMYAMQEWERRFNTIANWFVETASIDQENNAGRSLMRYLGDPNGIGSGLSAKGQAVIDFSTNALRLPNTLVGTIGGNAGDQNGSVWGTLTKFVRGSTITIQSGINGLIVAPTTTPTVAVTVDNNAALPAAGTYSVVFRETDSRFPSPGYKDTTINITVAPALNNTHKYRYYRMFVTAGTGGIYVDTLSIAAVPGGADTAAGVVTATASNFAAGFPPSNAFDGNASSFWADNDPPANSWIVADYGATSTNWIAANEFKLTPFNVNQAATDGSFQGSDDNSTWTTLKTFSGLTWSPSETKTFTV